MDTHRLPYGWGRVDPRYSVNSTGLPVHHSTVGQAYTLRETSQGRNPWSDKEYTSQVPAQWSDHTSPVGSYNRPSEFSQHVPPMPTSTGTVSPTAVFGEFAPPEVSFPNTTYSTPNISRGVTPDKRADELLCQILIDSGVWSDTHRKTLVTVPDSKGSCLDPASASVSHPTRRSSHGKVQKRTRIAQACEPCRKRKHKCSGSIGGKKCARCQSKKLGCVFAPTPTHPDGSQAGPKKQRTSGQTETDDTTEYINDARTYHTPKPEPELDVNLGFDYGCTSATTHQYQASTTQGENSPSHSVGTQSAHFDADVISYPAVHPHLLSFNALGLSNQAQVPLHFDPSTYQPPPTTHYYGSSNATIPVYQPVSISTVPQYDYSGDTTQTYSVPTYQTPYSGYYDTRSASITGNGLLMSQHVDNVSETSFGSTPRSSEAILSPWEYPLSAPSEMSYLATYTHNQPF